MVYKLNIEKVSIHFALKKGGEVNAYLYRVW
jgi:hypothetical protein